MQNQFISEEQLQEIEEIINNIKRKSSNGDCIYRSERKKYDKVSSALYREYIKIRKFIEIDVENFDLKIVEKHMLKVAKKHIGGPPKKRLEDFVDVRSERSIGQLTIAASLQRFIEKDEEDEELEILTQLQHYGGETNLIDFTTDFLIAVFFACSGSPKVSGRVIVLKKTQNIESMILRPQNPQHRVTAQKSIFLHPPKGFIDVPESGKVNIPAPLKEKFLKYLRKYHGISAETMYNDIHGFIRNQHIQRNAYVQFNLGLTLQFRGYHAEPGEEKQQAYKDAIEHYNEALELDSEISVAHGNRAECWLHLEEWNNAKRDFITVTDLGYDIVDAFHNDYENVEAFEKKTGIKLPPDIAEILGN